VLLRRLRWPVIYLGQNAPFTAVAVFAEEIQPAIIVFVAMLAETAQALMTWSRHMPQVAEAKTPVVAFGGRAFTQQPELIQQVPGLFLGMTLQEGLETLDRLLRELNPALLI
jgi:methanogenic corrinoid protein MtbC1